MLLPLYERSGQALAFLERLEQLLTEKLLPPQHWMTLATLYGNAGYEARRLACLEHLQEQNVPADTDPLMAARLLLNRGERGEALTVLRDAEGRYASHPEYWRERGDLAYLDGNLDEARHAYEALVGLDPENFRALFRLGNIHYRDGRLDAARDHFRRAAASNPRESKAWYNLGCVHEEAGATQEARSAFYQAVALNRRFAQAWNWLGIFHFREDNLRAARWAYLRCVAADHTSAAGWLNLGTLYDRLAAPEKAQACRAEAEKLGGPDEDDRAVAVRLYHETPPGEAAPAED